MTRWIAGAGLFSGGGEKSAAVAGAIPKPVQAVINQPHRGREVRVLLVPLADGLVATPLEL